MNQWIYCCLWLRLRAVSDHPSRRRMAGPRVLAFLDRWWTIYTSHWVARRSSWGGREKSGEAEVVAVVRLVQGEGGW